MSTHFMEPRVWVVYLVMATTSIFPLTASALHFRKCQTQTSIWCLLLATFNMLVSLAVPITIRPQTLHVVCGMVAHERATCMVLLASKLFLSLALLTLIMAMHFIIIIEKKDWFAMPLLYGITANLYFVAMVEFWAGVYTTSLDRASPDMAASQASSCLTGTTVVLTQGHDPSECCVCLQPTCERMQDCGHALCNECCITITRDTALTKPVRQYDGGVHYYMRCPMCRGEHLVPTCPSGIVASGGTSSWA